MSILAPCVGIAIVSYNTRELLRDCLHSLEHCSLALRIVVVDNQSADASAPMLRECFPHVELLEPGYNMGFAAGTNLAIRHLLSQGSGVGEQGSGERERQTLDTRQQTEAEQGSRGAGEQGNGGTGEQGNRGTGEQGNGGTGEQGNGGTGEQGNGGTGEIPDTRHQTPDTRQQTEADQASGRPGEQECAIQGTQNPKPQTPNPKPQECDYILLLNSDTVVHAWAIETLIDFLEAHPRVGMVGPRLLNADGSVQTAAFRFPTISMTTLDLFPPGEVLPGRLYSSWWHGRYVQEEQSQEPFPIDHPLGACILARRSMIDEIGLLDEGYFMYAEEVDWSLRAHRAGWAIWQQPMAQVTHIGGASTRQFRARMHVALYQSRLRFFQKHYGLWTIRMHRVVIAAGSLRAILLTWRDYARGHIQRDTLRERLWSHTTVLKIILNDEC